MGRVRLSGARMDVSGARIIETRVFGVGRSSGGVIGLGSLNGQGHAWGVGGGFNKSASGRL